jgi:hypothetical protein
MINTWFPRFVLASCFSVLAMAQNPANAVKSLIDKAATTGDPAEWAKYLIQADAEAEKLEQKTASGCCGTRCVNVGTFELHYRFNGIEGQEDYQHDLLQTIAMLHEGTAYGADALVRLLPGGCQTIASQWTPYFLYSHRYFRYQALERSQRLSTHQNSCGSV